jgi:hypothetical protein
MCAAYFATDRIQEGWVGGTGEATEARRMQNREREE